MSFLGLTMSMLLLSLPPIFMGSRGHAQNLDLDVVFRCAVGEAEDCLAARQTILNNCTSCHTFAPIVMQAFDSDGWTGLLDRHVKNGRVDQLSAAQVQQLHDYLADNFNGDLPPPELPAALLESWTSY